MPPESTPVAAHKIEVKHRGNALGFWLFRQQLKFFGLQGAYFMLSCVALHYLLFDADARRRSMVYVRRRFPALGILGRLNAVYRIFINQGRHLIDHFASLSGEVKFDLRLENKDIIEQVGRSREGCVLLTSHVGNWQIAMPAFAYLKKNVFLIMRPEDNQAVADSMGLDRENAQIRLISPEGDFGGAIEIVKAINDGAIVSMMGDRRYEFDSVRVKSFLGGAASFPYGAFHIAAACKVPVVVFMSAKTGPQQYTVSISRIIHPVYKEGRSKKDQITEWVQEYVTVLEDFVQKYPYQCFIFNDVWKEQ
ncbi:MAG: lysophospholipid acyltransferase family protein [Candidatus Omnitrophica bacterium]|nr:lysophospholipid acyltransferase family protein [Candidatus Omnitrophota bacterium]